MIATLVLEENAMKTLDVQALHKAIDQTVEQLKQQSEEIVNIKKRGRYHVAQRCLKRKRRRRNTEFL